jgi:DNA sulfur modification protein DndB
MRSKSVYSVSAIKRQNKGITIYSASVPFAFAAQSFTSFDSSLPPEERAQRVLDKRHAKQIRTYLENNPNYYLPPLIVSVTGEAEFKSFRQDSEAGTLKINMKGGLYKILDGQHRVQAIRDLLQNETKAKEFENESITVDFLLNVDLAQAQSYFRLLNATAKPVSKNLTILYSDNPKLKEIHSILMQVALFEDKFVEKEKTNLKAKSEKLFVYKWLFGATQRMKPNVTDEFDSNYCVTFWNTLLEVIPQWQAVLQGEASPADIRENYICSHGMFIDVLGELGKSLIADCQNNPFDVREYLKPLSNIDWSKTNKDWKNNVVDKNGKMLSRAGNRKFLLDYMLHAINPPRIQQAA